MKYLFDTNIIIGFLKNDIKIVERAGELEEINISVITVGEILYGANNSEKSEENIKKYKNFFEFCNIVNVTEKTAEFYAEIRYKLKKAGKPIPENDIWIAAIAVENGYTIITRDKHLKSIEFIKTEEW